MQRVCVARSLLLEPEALLLDEPTAPLDPENAELFRTLVERMRAKSGLAAVWVTHDPGPAGGRGGRRLVMAGGRLNGG
jgi:putative ABC transport system ATP-binding protein